MPGRVIILQRIVPRVRIPVQALRIARVGDDGVWLGEAEVGGLIHPHPAGLGDANRLPRGCRLRRRTGLETCPYGPRRQSKSLSDGPWSSLKSMACTVRMMRRVWVSARSTSDSVWASLLPKCTPFKEAPSTTAVAAK